MCSAHALLQTPGSAWPREGPMRKQDRLPAVLSRKPDFLRRRASGYNTVTASGVREFAPPLAP